MLWQPVLASQIQLDLPDRMPVNAEYLPGDTSKPAILVLHGFLQTYEFIATSNIVNGISGLGYTVLAPNLSLGVPNRKQSLQCSAPHTHNLDADLAEIDFWITWLKSQGYRSVILVGHSWGSQHSIAYRIKYPESPVTAIVAISLVRTHQTDARTDQQISAAQSRQASSPSQLHPYELSFCKEYMAIAQSYMSYAIWNDQKVFASLSELKKNKIPVYVVLGGSDKRIDLKWQQSIRSLVKETMIVDGANHFFSHLHEFELIDILQNILVDVAQ